MTKTTDTAVAATARFRATRGHLLDDWDKRGWQLNSVEAAESLAAHLNDLLKPLAAAQDTNK